MNKEKQISFMKQRIDSLEKQVKALQNENAVLVKENESVKRINSLKQETIDSLNDEIIKMQQSYSRNFDELSKAKDAYTEARESVLLMTSQYKTEVEHHLNRLRKQR